MFSRRALLALCTAVAFTFWAGNTNTVDLEEPEPDASDRRLRGELPSGTRGVTDVPSPLDHWQLDAPHVACRHVDSTVFRSRQHDSRVGIVSMQDRGDGGCRLVLLGHEERDVRALLRLGATALLDSAGATLVRTDFAQPGAEATALSSSQLHVTPVGDSEEPKPVAFAQQSDEEQSDGDTMNNGFGGILIALVITGLIVAIIKEYWDTEKEKKENKKLEASQKEDEDDRDDPDDDYGGDSRGTFRSNESDGGDRSRDARDGGGRY